MSKKRGENIASNPRLNIPQGRIADTTSITVKTSLSIEVLENTASNEPHHRHHRRGVVSTALQARQDIQRILAVTQDGQIGPGSLDALHALVAAPDDSFWPAEIPVDTTVHQVKASSFADPADVAARRKATDSARVKNWVKRNPERSREIKRAYKQRNREKVLGDARIYARKRRLNFTPEQKEAKRRYDNEWHHSVYPKSINHRLKVILRTRLYKAVRGIAKCSKTVNLLGCSIESFKLYIESRFEVGMSWENYGTWHIDHILPCAIFDMKREDHQRTCFHFSNLQPLWALENIKKGVKIEPARQH